MFDDVVVKDTCLYKFVKVYRIYVESAGKQ